MVNPLHPSTVQAELIAFGISWWRWELFGSIEQGDDAGAQVQEQRAGLQMQKYL